MTSTVLAFLLSEAPSGRGLGHAVICPEARYAAIAWWFDRRLERRVVHPAEWHLLASAFTLGLDYGALPLPSEHAVLRILLDKPHRESRIVQYLTSVVMTLDPPSASAALDAHLRAMPPNR